MKQRPTLVLVPGIGDDYDIYQTFARRWMRLGYDTHVISFGWADHTAPFTSKLETFFRKLDALQAQHIHIIGISAGGTVAVAALVERSDVEKVITVCTPLSRMSNLDNPLLQEGITQIEQHLASMDDGERGHILSAFGMYDQTVDTKLSRLPGIREFRIFMAFHAPTIFVALTLQARSLERFFRN